MNIIVRIILWILVISLATILLFPTKTSAWSFIDLFNRKVETKPRVETIDEKIDRISELYKVNPKVVKAIAHCESSMYGKAINENKDENGVVFSRDWGVLQINDYYHEKTMQDMGLDIHDSEDSLTYGIYLLSTGGTKFWSASKFCWSKKI